MTEVKHFHELPPDIKKEVMDRHTQDILARYDNSEYHNPELEEQVLYDLGYKIINQ